jgi:hypothetical protein
LSFAIDYLLFGREPLGYGFTNLALLIACAGALAALFGALGLRTGVALGGAMVWALNFQGINMAVLWISGRTALLLTLWAVAAAWAWARGARITAAGLATLAMWSKEEAFVLPAVLTVWAIVDMRGVRGPSERRRSIVRETALLWAAAVLSLGLRTQSGAYTPATAPSVYQYQFDLVTLADNALAYADRVGTTPILALFVFWLAAGAPRADIDSPVRRAMVKGAVWTGLGLVPTILLPVRSSLYAVMPSVGVVILLAAVAERIAIAASTRALKRAAIVLVIVFAALLPAYRARNQRYVSEAELSASIVVELQRVAASSPAGLVVIRDVRTGRPTAEQAFGSLADRAAELVTEGTLRVWIDPPPSELSGVAPPDLSQAIATLVVEHGQVTRAR